MVVTIGFLVSPRYTPGQNEPGVIRVSCAGCECGPHGTVSSHTIHSFPDLNSDAAEHRELGGNISVTATSDFLVGQSNRTPCGVQLTHLRAPAGIGNDRLGSSKIRIDTLYARLGVSKWEEQGISKSPSARAYLAFSKACDSTALATSRSHAAGSARTCQLRVHNVHQQQERRACLEAQRHARESPRLRPAAPPPLPPFDFDLLQDGNATGMPAAPAWSRGVTAAATAT